MNSKINDFIYFYNELEFLACRTSSMTDLDRKM